MASAIVRFSFSFSCLNTYCRKGKPYIRLSFDFLLRQIELVAHGSRVSAITTIARHLVPRNRDIALRSCDIRATMTLTHGSWLLLLRSGANTFHICQERELRNASVCAMLSMSDV